MTRDHLRKYATDALRTYAEAMRRIAKTDGGVAAHCLTLFAIAAWESRRALEGALAGRS